MAYLSPLLTLLIVGLIVTSCAPTHKIGPNFKFYRKACTKIGHERGTDMFIDCVQHMYLLDVNYYKVLK